MQVRWLSQPTDHPLTIGCVLKMSWLKSWLKSPVMIWLADLRNFLRTVQSTWKQSIVSCEVDTGRFSENEILLCCHQIFEQYSDFCLKRLVTRWAMSRTACSVCSWSYVCETICSCYFWTDRNYDHRVFSATFCYLYNSLPFSSHNLSMWQNLFKINLPQNCSALFGCSVANLLINFKCTEYLKAFLGLFI